MRFFTLLPLLYLASHVYVFVCLRRAFGGGKWQIPAALWLLAMGLSWLWRFGRPFGGALGDRFQMVSFCWTGLLVMLCYCLIAADAAALVSRIVGLVLPGGTAKAVASYMSAPRYVPLALVLAALLYAFGLYQAVTPQVRTVTITSPKLPQGRELRVAGIADLHLGPLIGPMLIERAAARLAEIKPDIILFAGDIVDADMSARQREAELLRGLEAPLGKYAVTGNHEYYRGGAMALRFFEAAGLRALRGDFAEPGGIVLAGVDDSAFAGTSGAAATDELDLLARLPQERFILLMNHRPQMPPQAIGAFDLQYSGHTHGGQIWPGSKLTRSIYGLGQGLSVLRQEGRQSLIYVTDGLGFWGPPVRLGTVSEITLIILKHGPELGAE